MDLYTKHEKHQAAIINKAERCLPLLEEWAQNLGGERAEALGQIHDALNGGKGVEVAEQFWAKLADLHHERYPHHPGRPEFTTSRPIILAKLEARIWTAGQPQPADPFAALDDHQPASGF
jgi:hypothetical protein